MSGTGWLVSTSGKRKAGPLVGVVLDQRVDEGQRRIGRDDRSPRERRLEPADQRRAVDLGALGALGRTALSREYEQRHQRDRRAGNVHVLGRVADDPAVRDAPEAQHRAQLAAVGRTGRADDLEAGVGHGVPPRKNWQVTCHYVIVPKTGQHLVEVA